jgi:hypothetical protein
LYGFDTDTGELLFEDDSYTYKAMQPIVYNHRLYVIASNSIIELGNDLPSDMPEPREERVALKIYPNPGKGLLTIEFTLKEVSVVSLSVFSLSGVKNELLSDQILEPGNHSFIFDSNQLLPGTYFCEARIADNTRVGQFLKQRTKFVLIE